MSAPLRSFVPLPAVLAAPPGPPGALPWPALCDGVYCIVTTTPSGRARWPKLRLALREAQLLTDAALAVVNAGPCGEHGEPVTSQPTALIWSHLSAVLHARAAGLERVLLLEDDVYFALPELRRLLTACAATAFRAAQLEAAALYLGGVHVSTQPSERFGLHRGRAFQTHAYVAHVRHPAWDRLLAAARADTALMFDTLLFTHAGPCWLAQPSVAFQRSFGQGTPAKWVLEGVPPLCRGLTHVLSWFDVGNCWETCACTTNGLVAVFGSIAAAVTALGALAVLLVALLWCLGRRAWR